MQWQCPVTKRQNWENEEMVYRTKMRGPNEESKREVERGEWKRVREEHE